MFSNEISSAVFSADEKYRYVLRRSWAETGDTIGFICLNPSTADATVNDQTVRKCISFAQRWGGARLVIGNLFAYRSTDPSNLYKVEDPVGPDNDSWLRKIADECDILVAAWGVHGKFLSRDKRVKDDFGIMLKTLKLTKDGHPSHPLYLPSGLEPKDF